MKDILLIIDMQNAYKTGRPWCCPKMTPVTENIIRLLTTQQYRDVIFTRHLPARAPVGTWKNYNQHYDEINHNPQLSEIIDELKPYTGQAIILDKTTYSAASVLPGSLFSVPCPRIIITGVVAQCCVLSTVLGLIDRGNEIIYLKDAVAGQHQNFEDMTEAIINTFSPLHTTLMTTTEYLNSK